MTSTVDWTMAVAAIVQTILLAAAGVYGIRQVRESRQARHVALFLPMFQELNGRPSVSARRRLYLEIAPKGEDASQDERDTVNEIVNQLDLLGYLIRLGSVEKRVVLGFYYGTIIRCWRDSEWYIMEQRRLRGSNFAEHFEWLAGHAVKYRQKTYPSDRLARFDPSTPEQGSRSQ